MSSIIKGHKRILLADADAFYVAVARLSDPEGAGKEPLLIVGGSSNRGVVTSASYEARAFGVRSAMPTARALRLCPKAVVVPVSRTACAENSRAIRSALEKFTPVVEPASIDEFYLDMEGTETLYHESLADTADRIRGHVLSATGLSVSVGGGTSRLIAKLAAKRAKPRRNNEHAGVYIVPPGEEARFVSELDLADIPMIGPRFQETLAGYGLKTVRQALQHDVDVLAGWFGKRRGRWLYNRIRGIDSALVDERRPAKSISHEETFSEDIADDEKLSKELLRLAVRTAAGLRHQGYVARTITVKLRDSDFTTRQASKTLPHPVSADRPIIETAAKLLKRLRRSRRTAARLLGVGVSQLEQVSRTTQLAIFDDLDDSVETKHDRAISGLVDNITDRFGRKSIVRGSEVKGR